MAKSKKKRDESEAVESQTEAWNAETKPGLVNGDSHETKQHKKKKSKKKRESEKDDAKPKPKPTPTVSIAVPGSIIDNAQSLELATRVTPSISLLFLVFPKCRKIGK